MLQFDVCSFHMWHKYKGTHKEIDRHTDRQTDSTRQF